MIRNTIYIVAKKRDNQKIFYLGLYLVLLIFVLALISFKGANFVLKDKLFLSEDEFQYYEYSIYNYYRIFDRAMLFEPFSSFNHKCPMIYLTTSFFYLFLPIQTDVVFATNLLYLIFIFIALSILEYKLKGDFKKGIYSPFIFLLIQYWLKFASRYYFPQIAVAFFFILLLIVCKAYNKKYFPLAMGTIIGLGMLSHITYVVFLFIPAVFSFKACFKEFGLKKTVLKFIFIGCIAGVVCGWWYIPNFKPVVDTYLGNVLGSQVIENEDMSTIFSLEHFLFYVGIFYERLPKAILFVFIIISIFSFSDSKRYKEVNFITLSFLFPFAIFSLFIFRREINYLLPAIPLIPLSISLFFGEISNNNKKLFFTVFFAILAIVSVLFTYNWLEKYNFFDNPDAEIKKLVYEEQPKAVFLYSFYPRLYFNIRQLQIVDKMKINLKDCIFNIKDIEECSDNINSSIIFISPGISCQKSNILRIDRNCDRHHEYKDYFYKYYSNSALIGNFSIRDWTGNITVLAYRVP